MCLLLAYLSMDHLGLQVTYIHIYLTVIHVLCLLSNCRNCRSYRVMSKHATAWCRYMRLLYSYMSIHALQLDIETCYSFMSKHTVQLDVDTCSTAWYRNTLQLVVEKCYSLMSKHTTAWCRNMLQLDVKPWFSLMLKHTL